MIELIPPPKNLPSPTVIYLDSYGLSLLKQAMARALNVWDTAPAEIKEFGDMLEHGKILQDYRAQDSGGKLTTTEEGVKTDTPKVGKYSDLPFDEIPNCSDCGGKGLNHLHTCPVLTKK